MKDVVCVEEDVVHVEEVLGKSGNEVVEKNKSRIECFQAAKARSSNRFEILDSMSDAREVHEDDNAADHICIEEVNLEPRKARVAAVKVVELMKTLSLRGNDLLIKARVR